MFLLVGEILLGFVFLMESNAATGMTLNIRALAVGMAESIHQSWKVAMLFLPVISNLMNMC